MLTAIAVSIDCLYRVRGLALRLVKLAEDVDTFAMQRVSVDASCGIRRFLVKHTLTTP